MINATRMMLSISNINMIDKQMTFEPMAIFIYFYNYKTVDHEFNMADKV